MNGEHSIKLNLPKDCDNAPKRRVIRDFIVALYQKDLATVNMDLEDEFEFNAIGNKIIESKEALEKYVNRNPNIVELRLDEVLSHGKFGACNGVFKTKNEEIAFAYFLEFKSAGRNTIKVVSEYKIVTASEIIG